MSAQPRWVVDTNVVVSAFLWRGLPGRVLELAGERSVRLFTSRVLLSELATTLAKKKLGKFVVATGLTAEQMVANYKRVATTVTARQLESPVCRDADDDAVLACALAAHAELIITGDDDLLSLRQSQGFDIVTVREALARLPGASAVG